MSGSARAGTPFLSGYGAMQRPQTGFHRLDGGTATVGMSTNVQLDHRPVTNHGLTGMKSSHGAAVGMRKVADRSYYEGELRKRIAAVASEITKLKKEHHEHATSDEQREQLTTQRDTLLNEVRTYEGQLADFNLALDKVRTNATLEDLEQACGEIRANNQQESQRVDSIFLEAKQVEGQVQQMQEQLAHLHAGVEEQLSTMDAELVRQYRQLRGQQQQLQEQSNMKRMELAEIEHRLEAAQGELQRGEYKMHVRGLAVHKQLEEMATKQAQLVEDTDMSLTPEQMKEKIVVRVKEDNKTLQDCKKKVKHIEDRVDELRDEIDTREKEVEEMRQYSKQAAKYEALFEREKKMARLIAEFPAQLEKWSRHKDSLQSHIVTIMEHISAQIEKREGTAAQSKAQEAEGELAFKERQKGHSDTTAAHLKKELEKRKAELAKVSGLDAKITTELGKLREKVRTMKQDINGFKTPAQIKEEHEIAKKLLLTEKMRSRQERQVLEKKATQLQKVVEAEESQLNNMAYHQDLQTLEAQLQDICKEVHEMDDFIESRRRESDYESLLQDVRLMVNKINGHVIKHCEREY